MDREGWRSAPVSAVPAWLEIAAAAGTALGGFAAVCGVFYAAIEVQSWKRREVKAARAAAAKRALPTLESFALALRALLNAMVLGASDASGYGGARSIAHASQFFERFRDEADEAQKELAHAGLEAEAVLEQDEAASLRVANSVFLHAVAGVWGQAQAEAMRWEQASAGGQTHGFDLRALVERPLRDLEQQLNSALEEGRRVLGAIARHETPPRAPRR